MKKRYYFGILMVIFLGLVYINGALRTHRRDWPVAVTEHYIEETTWQRGNHESEAEQTVKSYADAHDHRLDDYPGSLIRLLERKPETEEFVLGYAENYGKEPNFDFSEYNNCEEIPLFLQWDMRWGYMDYGEDVAGLTACGPVCLSMAAVYLTGDCSYDPAFMIRFAIENGYCVYGQGSSWTLISEGGEKLGLDVTELPLDKSRIVANLDAGNPVICVMGPGDFTTTGHFVVLTGNRDGGFTLNDPNSPDNSARIWYYEDIADQIENLWALRN